MFSQQVKKGNSRLKKDVGRGALYDMGIYCINAARYLFQANYSGSFRMEPEFRRRALEKCARR